MGTGWQLGWGTGAGHRALGTRMEWDLGAPSGVLGANPSFYGLGQEKQSGVHGSPCCHGRGPAPEWCLPSWLHPGMGQGMAYCGSLLLVGFVEDKVP